MRCDADRADYGAVTQPGLRRETDGTRDRGIAGGEVHDVQRGQRAPVRTATAARVLRDGRVRNGGAVERGLTPEGHSRQREAGDRVHVVVEVDACRTTRR